MDDFTDLRGSEFTRADLTGARFTSALLNGATFRGCDLHHVVMRGVEIVDATIDGEYSGSSSTASTRDCGGPPAGFHSQPDRPGLEVNALVDPHPRLPVVDLEFVRSQTADRDMSRDHTTSVIVDPLGRHLPLPCHFGDSQGVLVKCQRRRPEPLHSLTRTLPVAVALTSRGLGVPPTVGMTIANVAAPLVAARRAGHRETARTANTPHIAAGDHRARRIDTARPMRRRAPASLATTGAAPRTAGRRSRSDRVRQLRRRLDSERTPVGRVLCRP